MAGINKPSLREEFDTAKAQFERLCTGVKWWWPPGPVDGGAVGATDGRIHAKTQRTSKHPGKPASEPPKDDTAVTRTGGKGNSQPNAHSGNTRTIETTQVVAVDQCDTCGEDLSGTPCQGHERPTRIDNGFAKVMSYLDTEVEPCPRGQVQTKRCFLVDRQDTCCKSRQRAP